MATQATQELEAMLKAADVLMDEMATRMTVINTYRARLDSSITSGLSWFQSNISNLNNENDVKQALIDNKNAIDTTIRQMDKAETAFLQVHGSVVNLMNSAHEMLAIFKEHVDRMTES